MSLAEFLGQPFHRLMQRYLPEDPRITLLREQIAHYRKEADCRRIINSAMVRYFVQHQRTADIAIPFEQVEIDSNPDWIPYVLEKMEMTEPEFAIFRFFQDEASTILDIGANYGYSVGSIWKSGSKARIISFEPNAWHQACLQRIKELRSGCYDFINCGLGSAAQDLRFVVPVIEGVGQSGLSSAAIETELDYTLPECLLKVMMAHPKAPEIPRLQFAETHWKIEPLDAILARHRFEISLDPIVAIKIDVEGYEPEVLEGAAGTLRQHRPLVMIETANRVPAVGRRMARLGYRYADFQNGAAFLSAERSTRVSGFYMHASRLEEYRRLGLLIEPPSPV